MNMSKITNWVVVGLCVLFFLWLANLLLGLSFGIIHFAISLVVGLFKIVFSKTFFVIAGIALVIYLLSNRRESKNYGFHRDDYRG